jgi:hypothetical protein
MATGQLLALTRDNLPITPRETPIKNLTTLARTETEVGMRNRNAETVLGTDLAIIQLTVQETGLELTETGHRRETGMATDQLLALTRDNLTITLRETPIKNRTTLARTETEVGMRNRNAETVLLKLRD